MLEFSITEENKEDGSEVSPTKESERDYLKPPRFNFLGGVMQEGPSIIYKDEKDLNG